MFIYSAPGGVVVLDERKKEKTQVLYIGVKKETPQGARQGKGS